MIRLAVLLAFAAACTLTTSTTTVDTTSCGSKISCNKVCVDPLTSATNCGACNHAWLDHRHLRQGWRRDHGSRWRDVYYVNRGTLSSEGTPTGANDGGFVAVNKASGAVTLLAGHLPNVDAFAVNGFDVLFAGLLLMQVSYTGGDVTPVWPNDTVGIAADAVAVFAGSGHQIATKRVADTSAFSLYQDPNGGEVQDVVIDASDVYALVNRATGVELVKVSR